MKTSLLVHCEQCGYENFPQHRFCGMCGAELPPLHLQPLGAPSSPPTRQPAPPAKEAGPQPVSGPPSLGLAEEPTERQRFSYLLDDREEESSSRRRRYLLLILLIVATAVAAWYWRQDLRVIAARFTGSGSGASEEKASSSSPPTSASPSEVAPANTDTQLEKPKTGVGEQPTTTPPQAASPAPAPSGAPPAPSPGTAAPSGETQQAAQPQPSAEPPQGESSQSAGSAPPEGESATAAAQAPGSPSARSVSAPKSPRAQLQPAASSDATADALEVQGEKYLYGNGVPQNCALAQKSLLAAAARSNGKAQSVLGTMYATGHCAGRDLPVAYRWFARALRQDLTNTRIEQDLKVLWNQMTPDERQRATRSGQ